MFASEAFEKVTGFPVNQTPQPIPKLQKVGLGISAALGAAFISFIEFVANEPASVVEKFANGMENLSGWPTQPIHGMLPLVAFAITLAVHVCANRRQALFLGLSIISFTLHLLPGARSAPLDGERTNPRDGETYMQTTPEGALLAIVVRAQTERLSSEEDGSKLSVLFKFDFVNGTPSGPRYECLLAIKDATKRRILVRGKVNPRNDYARSLSSGEYFFYLECPGYRIIEPWHELAPKEGENKVMITFKLRKSIYPYYFEKFLMPPLDGSRGASSGEFSTETYEDPQTGTIYIMRRDSQGNTLSIECIGGGGGMSQN